jgi:hypothetical protein
MSPALWPDRHYHSDRVTDAASTSRTGGIRAISVRLAGREIVAIRDHFGGRNCIGPSAPAELAPECTPGRLDVPLDDSTVPMAASTVQGRPGQVAAADSWTR